MSPTHEALQRFSAPTREWFGAAFAEPTSAQVGAWEAIAQGRHALVVAPTGSGKTLSSAVSTRSTDGTTEENAALGSCMSLP
jgi:ATP-dependent Lhr-like helicase